MIEKHHPITWWVGKSLDGITGQTPNEEMAEIWGLDPSIIVIKKQQATVHFTPRITAGVPRSVRI